LRKTLRSHVKCVIIQNLCTCTFDFATNKGCRNLASSPLGGCHKESVQKTEQHDESIHTFTQMGRCTSSYVSEGSSRFYSHVTRFKYGLESKPQIHLAAAIDLHCDSVQSCAAERRCFNARSRARSLARTLAYCNWRATCSPGWRIPIAR